MKNPSFLQISIAVSALPSRKRAQHQNDVNSINFHTQVSYTTCVSHPDMLLLYFLLWSPNLCRYGVGLRPEIWREFVTRFCTRQLSHPLYFAQFSTFTLQLSLQFNILLNFKLLLFNFPFHSILLTFTLQLSTSFHAIQFCSIN